MIWERRIYSPPAGSAVRKRVVERHIEDHCHDKHANPPWPSHGSRVVPWLGRKPSNALWHGQVVEPGTTVCSPVAKDQLHKIGEDVNEVLDVIPATLWVAAHHSPQICLPRLDRRSSKA